MALGRASSRRRALGGRQRRGERGHGSLLSSMREKSMRTRSSLIFWTKGYLGCVGPWLGPVVGLLLGRIGKVRSGKVFFSFFSFIYFLFCISTLNSDLNSKFNSFLF
jgi:hypothetical protein